VQSKTTARGPAISSEDYARLAAFRHAVRAFLHFSDAAADEVGLTGQHYQALLILRARPEGEPVAINDLAQDLFLKHNSAVGLVDRLAAEGLVVRVASTLDKRKVELRLTPRGARLLARLAERHRAELQRVGPELEAFFHGLSQQARARAPAAAKRRLAAG
jgi:DNA-binding MarR family transcriptional regulator